MKSEIEDFKTGWFGISLGLNNNEIENLIAKLRELKENKDHFHYRSDFIGKEGIGDIEFYYTEEDIKNDLSLDTNKPISE